MTDKSQSHRFASSQCEGDTPSVVVWRALVGPTTQTQRLGIVVQAGRIYTLTATCNSGAASEMSGSMVALALPKGGQSR